MLPIRADRPSSGQGFTLIEAVIVIAITGIIAGIVAVFIRAPVDAYFDSVRRAEMTDIADTALRRMARDVRLALPNSVRVFTPDGTTFYLEFLQTRSGARYRQNDACFAADCSSLTTFGSITPEVAIAVNSDRVAIYNQYNNEAGGCGPSDPSAYCGTNTAVITGITNAASEDVVSFAATAFPHASPSNRFQIIEGPVSYVCTPGASGTGTLRRHWGYAIAAAQPTVFGGATALLATRVSACNIAYAPGITERGGLLNMRLTLSQANEDISLQNQVHVSNVP